MDFFVCDEVEIENQIPVIEHDFRETKSQLFAQTERLQSFYHCHFYISRSQLIHEKSQDFMSYNY